MIKKMVWEAWVDPFKSNKTIKDPLSEYEQEEGHDEMSIPQKMAIMHTPFGPLPLTEYSGASDRFEFHILHTNFNVTEELVDVVDVVNGVDSVDAISRYRFRIGFPITADGSTPIFNSSTTKLGIQDQIISFFHHQQDEQLEIFNQNLRDRAIEVRNKLDSKHEFWALYILPNGQMDIVSSDKHNEEFTNKIQQLEVVHNLVSGVLLTSE